MDRIGRYQIVKELGRGAMGVVYQAIDPNIGRPVAIKTIRLGEVDDAERREKMRERLFREARSAGVLSHPGIVTVYDMDEEDGLAYITMEFVNGPTLDQVLSSGQPLASERMFSILRQTAAALDYAHQKDIVHRDIKPANIMIDEEESVKIADFGIAKIGAAENLTLTGTIVGTPNYMSPEQVQGIDVDDATDQFSLAVVAYEILTGERPFPGEHLTTVVYKIVAEDPVPPHRINPSLGPEIDSVLRRGLAKKPGDRYPSCGTFVGALEWACAATKGWHSLAREGSLALPTVVATSGGTDIHSTAPRAEKRRSRSLIVIPVAALALGLIGFAAWETGWTSREFTPPAPPPRAEPPGIDHRPSPMPPPASAAEEPAQMADPVPERTHPQIDSSQTLPEGTKQELWITTNPPGARATLDDRSETACQTPCVLRAEPGQHAVSVTLAGFQTERRQVRVTGGPLDVPPIIFQKETGTLMLTTTPPGASILVDDRPLPQVTPAQIKLAPGAHQLVVEKNGKRATEQIEIRSGATNFLKIPLGP